MIFTFSEMIILDSPQVSHMTELLHEAPYHLLHSSAASHYFRYLLYSSSLTVS